MTEPKAYTTAIIAAVPAKDDPVHEVVAEDAHVTLQFLGEAADLDEDQITAIEQSLEMLASVVYPFQADISGTAELGPDKAQVLIVQSALLSKIRETLGMADAVSTAVASVEQFPNWIPHLTLAYEGEMPDVSAYEQVTIGSLELWLAEEHRVYNLAQPKTAVTAAGVKEFEEGLHPRGADGRFIEKFGVIKFLTGMGWQYGKVEGIYHDKGSGAVQLTVTPSDLSGKTHGDSVVLSPKQVYRAPKTKAHLPISSLGVQKVGGQAGSNQGGLYNIPHPGTTSGTVEPHVDQFYVKKPKTKSHGNNEALANALYEEAGVPVPEVDYHPDGQLYSKIVKGQQDMAQQLNNPEWADQVRRNFAVDAWLGNRDVFGLTYDNVLTDENGVPWRIDNGGALLYRAMGEKKTDFGGKVTELDVFRTGKKAKIYGTGMSKAQELDGAERVLAISPGQIDDMVAEHNLPKSLADTLKARRAYIASYYGLALPESKAPAEAEGPTSAPLVDAPDIAASGGKTRNWFKTTLAMLPFFGQGGDNIELPDGNRVILGKDDDDGSPLSIVGMQSQVLGWTTQYQPDAEIFLRKFMAGPKARPEHGSKLAGSDLSAQNWKRGDELISDEGQVFKIRSWNSDTGAVLIQSGDTPPLLLDTHGKDANDIWTVERWDPPAVDTPEPAPVPDVTPLQTEQQAIDIVQEEATPAANEWDAAVSEAFAAPVSGKTGQAAVAEAQIKADLDAPLPSGNGTAPPPKKTSAPGGAKTMVIGDGTEAATGDAVTSKKDGKTYTFVKPKGQYAVVTDPNGEDPDKQLLKLASTMTQPGKAPQADVADIEAPKTATGEVPALGMMAVAKDGWAGEIKMISPDGKFVFIYDANGVKKRKSTGTVSITSAPQGPADTDAPKKAPGPVKDYGTAPESGWTGEEKATGWLLPDSPQMHAGLMVHVGYADGSDGLEPYSGQPLEAMETNSQGKVAVFGDLPGYLGPVSSNQLASAGQANNKATTYQVIYAGNVFFTDGTTGPNGGLVLWYSDDNDADTPGTDAWETPPTIPVTLTIIGSETATSTPLTLPEGVAFQTADEPGLSGMPVNPPLYSDEAKTLSQWKGQLSVGQEISLDGHNWMAIQDISPGGAVKAETGSGPAVYLNPWSSATYVVKAPPMKDGDAPSPAMQPTPEVPGADALPVSTGKKKIGDLVQGDVVTDGEGTTTIIDSVTDPDNGTATVWVKAMGEDWPSMADPTFEFTHHGNLTEGPVSIPIGLAAPHLYPGAKVELGTAWHVQLVSYPELMDNGNYRFAAIKVDDPSALFMIEVGDAPGSDISGNVPVPVHLDSFTTGQAAGADPAQINALFDVAKTESQDSTDHHAQMTDQGIPFGTAAYPIYYNEQSQTYFRAGHSGLQEWDDTAGTWNNVFGTVEDKTKVWEGVPFEGQLALPEGFPTTILANSGGNVLDYKPQPGETIQVAKIQMGADQQSVLISYPFGLDGPAHTVITPADGSEPKMSDGPFQAGWKESGVFTEFTTIHDPFGTPETGPPTTHQAGAQPPAVLGAKLQTLGYTPAPGDQFFYAQSLTSASNPVFLKGDDGRYHRMAPNNVLSTSSYTLDELSAPDFFGDGSFDFFTWAYLPTGTDAPVAVPGLPDGFAPYVPSQGQSLLKVTLPNGKQNVYLQSQPGAGWYEMDPDGSVNESSDAVKSDFVVQKKLATNSSGSAAKYQLLHPAPEGAKKPNDPVPTFTNQGGSFTPEPGQKVVALSSFSGDPDPWFYVQNAPGEDWQPAPGIPGDPTGVPDASLQGFLAQTKSGTSSSGSTWSLVYDGPSGQSAVDTPEKALPTFSGYTPKEGEQVFEEPNGSHWVLTPDDGKYHPTNDDGTLDTGYGVTQQVWENDSQTKTMPQVWPTEAPSAPETAPAVPAVPAAPQTFGGYTPDEGEKVAQVGADDLPTKHFYVQQSPGEQWKLIGGDGQPTLSSPLSDEAMQQALGGTPGVKLVYEGGGAPAGPGGVFAGYQTDAGDSVIEFTLPGGNVQTLVKKSGTNTWNVVLPGGYQLGNPDDGDAFSQDTIEWAATEDTSGYGVTVLQGTVKAAPVTDPEPLDTSGPAYAGVAETTVMSSVAWTLEDPAIQLSTYIQEKINGAVLAPGESLYVINGNPHVRDSTGKWFYLYSAENERNLTWTSDEEVEQYAASEGYTLTKVHFAAPQQAPAPAVNTYAGPVISGWGIKGLPDPASMGFVGGPSDAVGQKAGTWLFTQTTMSNMAATGTGLYVQLAEDVTGDGSTAKVSSYVPVKNGVVGDQKFPTTGNPINFNLSGVQHIYAQNFTGTQAAPGTQAPAAAPSAPTPAAPSAPAVPAYPGAQKPSQEDINAWGGSLTKDGHIPSAGMFVTGKGPMSGKIVSVSKDKTKAVVLTSDGKKTTRLIEALKTDPSANYSAYAAPVTLKDIPQGMPLAVDTVAEALVKTAQDGKFRAILNGHPGVSGGQMVVTKTTAPSGKTFNRVHLTLTPAQREQLISMLSGTGEKGDWVKKSKASEAVAIGDQLPMRKSSQDNPDGTPRWKVDPDTKPPTHTVSKVEDDPSGSGVKIVTMKNITTGEEITSRFHPGKALSFYEWDPNKPKTITAGALSLSETAKAQGWTHVSDGGISAIKGGAENGKLYHEPGTAVSKSAFQDAGHSWQTLRNVSADGVVIEVIAPKGPNKNSTTGATVVSVPQGVGEQAFGAALAKMGIDYRPMNQDDAKVAVRGTLRTLLNLDTSDVDTPKHYTDEQLFAQAGKSMGISDLGWQDVLIGVDDTTGKTSFFWSDRARNALAGKTSYNLVYRSANTADAAAIVSTVKYGSANSVLKRTTGMIDTPTGKGTGASWSSDQANHAGHGSYSSAGSVAKLPTSNSQASYKSTGMMVYSRPEAVLGRIADFRLANSDAFGMGQGQGADHLKAATTMTKVKDFFIGGGLPTEAVGFIAVGSASERAKAIEQLKADGFAQINGRPIEDIIITQQKASTLTPSDLPPVTIPANARPILDLPVSYDAPAPAAGATTGGEAAA